MTRWLAAAVLAAAIAIAAWWGYTRLASSPPPTAARVEQLVPEGAAPETIETVATADAAAPTGGTPMAQRVAVIGLLNKRNGESREVTLKPGEAKRYGDAVIRLAACEQTAPYEADQLTGAFVQLDVRGADRNWRRAFSGWLFKERPALNVVPHPVYDVWTKSCAMTFPDGGPETERLSAPRRSSAPKSARARGSSSAAPDDAAAEAPAPPSAVASNAT